MNLSDKQKPGCVYLHRNKKNNKGYVGWTVLTMENRWKGHLKCAVEGSQQLFHKAIRKWGLGDDVWDHIVLEQCKSAIEAAEREIYWIKQLNTYSPNGCGYNQTTGGDGVLSWTLEMRENHSKKAKAVYAREGVREQHSAIMKRVYASEELREEMRQRYIGIPFTTEQRERLKEIYRLERKLKGNRVLSNETRMKMRTARLGKKNTEAQKRKMSLAMTGNSSTTGMRWRLDENGKHQYYYESEERKQEVEKMRAAEKAKRRENGYHSALLTDEQLIEICRLKASGWLSKDLAVKYEVSESHISRILNSDVRGL